MRSLPRHLSILSTTAMVLGMLLVALSPGAALASETQRTHGLCVNPGGGGGCYNTIAAAIDAARSGDTIRIAKGNYAEHGIMITKPLTLKGAGAGETVVDATGHTAGITVQGVKWGETTISGLTVKNAGLEGIAVRDSSHVTVRNNRVLNNDKSLQPNFQNPFATTCPDDPEPFEAMDCGEAIHLEGASYSVVANNLVERNAGGILSSDESGPTHNNYITRNTVKNNILDCGIIMASHGPGNGIYKNVVAFNLSKGNGAAGVGIFGSIPGTSTHDNLVLGNTITGNGEAGVALHIHGPGVTLDNNKVIGNVISGNGGDPDPAVNLPSIGIEVFTDLAAGAAPIRGAVLNRNTIRNQAVDVYVGLAATSLTMRFNSLGARSASGATAIGVDNAGTGKVDARWNYWGCSGGPGAAGCSTVKGSVTFKPWLRHWLGR